MELWYVTGGKDHIGGPEAYFVGPRKWEPERAPFFDWSAVFIRRHKGVADFVASAVNALIMAGFDVDNLPEPGRSCWHVYQILPDDVPESYALTQDPGPLPDDATDEEYNARYPVHIHRGGLRLVNFVRLALDRAFDGLDWVVTDL